MAKNIQILKRSTIEVPDISSYKLVLEAVNAESMPNKIFVNQRIRNFAKGTVEDTFAAVCTPVQLEDFPEDAPAPGSTYYRTNSIEIVTRTPEMLQTAFDSIVYEVKKLVIDLEDLENLSQPQLYNVSPLIELTEISTLSLAELAALTEAEVTQLDKYSVAALSPAQLDYLSPLQLAALTTAQMGALTASQLGSLSTDTIAGFSLIQVAALALSAVAALKPLQIAAMSVEQITAFTPAQLYVLNAQQVAAIKVEAIALLSTEQIAAFSTKGVAGMTIEEVGAMSTEQLAAMDPEDVAAIAPQAIHVLTPEQVGAFTTDELAAFTVPQAAALTESQKAELTDLQKEALPTIPAPTLPAAPTLWLPSTSVAGNVPEIVDLSDFATNMVRANIGNAASWTITPYSFENNGVVTYENDGILFSLTNVSNIDSKAILSVVYKNNAADPDRPGIDSSGNQFPYMYIRNLSGALHGKLTFKWNGVTVLTVPSGDMPSGVFDYYPDDPANFGAAGRLVPGQSTALIVEISAIGSATTINGELFFGYYL